jgi:hypothetical protein
MVDHSFGTMRLPGERDAIAPDGSCVRVLLRLAAAWRTSSWEQEEFPVRWPTIAWMRSGTSCTVAARCGAGKETGRRQCRWRQGPACPFPPERIPVPVIPGWSADGRGGDDAAMARRGRGLRGQREVGARSALSR